MFHVTSCLKSGSLTYRIANTFLPDTSSFKQFFLFFSFTFNLFLLQFFGIFTLIYRCFCCLDVAILRQHPPVLFPSCNRCSCGTVCSWCSCRRRRFNHAEGRCIRFQISSCHFRERNRSPRHFFFPRPPSVDSTAVVLLIDLVCSIRQLLKWLHYVKMVPPNEPCPVGLLLFQSCADGLRQNFEKGIQLIEAERSAIASNLPELLRVTTSFTSPPMELPSSCSIHHHSWQTSPAMRANSGVVGRVSGNLIRNDPCEANRIFRLCSEYSAPKNNVRNCCNDKTTSTSSGVYVGSENPPTRSSSSCAEKSLIPRKALNASEMSQMTFWM